MISKTIRIFLISTFTLTPLAIADVAKTKKCFDDLYAEVLTYFDGRLDQGILADNDGYERFKGFPALFACIKNDWHEDLDHFDEIASTPPEKMLYGMCAQYMTGDDYLPYALKILELYQKGVVTKFQLYMTDIQVTPTLRDFDFKHIDHPDYKKLMLGMAEAYKDDKQKYNFYMKYAKGEIRSPKWWLGWEPYPWGEAIKWQSISIARSLGLTKITSEKQQPWLLYLFFPAIITIITLRHIRKKYFVR